VKRSVCARPSRLDATAKVGRREEAGELVHGVGAEEDARSGALDLELLLREEQEDEVDDQVGALERLDGRPIAGERRCADGPGADLAVEARRRLGQAEMERARTECGRGREKGIGVVEALVALGDDGDRLALVNLAELELSNAELR
jgi:hypothetical protein